MPMCFINTVRPEAGLKVCCEPTSALGVHPWMAPEKAGWGPSKRGEHEAGTFSSGLSFSELCAPPL